MLSGDETFWLGDWLSASKSPSVGEFCLLFRDHQNKVASFHNRITRIPYFFAIILSKSYFFLNHLTKIAVYSYPCAKVAFLQHFFWWKTLIFSILSKINIFSTIFWQNWVYFSVLLRYFLVFVKKVSLGGDWKFRV